MLQRWALASMLAVLSVHAQDIGAPQVTEPGQSMQAPANGASALTAKEPCWVGTGCVPQSDLDYNERVANGEIPLVIENGIRPDAPSAPTASSEQPNGAAQPSGTPQDGGQATTGIETDPGAIAARYAGEILGGDAGLACEAILCLAAAGDAPAECARSLKRYFSIVFKSWTRTVNARRAFLALCPIADSSGMPALVDALTNGAGLCDVASLNRPITMEVTDASDGITIISNVMPAACDAYYRSELINTPRPRYIGTPEQGGHWVAAESSPEEVISTR